MMRKLRLKTKPDDGKVPDEVARWVEAYVSRRLAEVDKQISAYRLQWMLIALAQAEDMYIQGLSAQLMAQGDLCSGLAELEYSNGSRSTTLPPRLALSGARLDNALEAMLDHLDKASASLDPVDLMTYKVRRKLSGQRIKELSLGLVTHASLAHQTPEQTSWLETLENDAMDIDIDWQAGNPYD